MKLFKMLSLASFLLVMGLQVNAQKEQATGIQFFKGTFAEAQALAKEEGKLIFMDAYATWCGPCKWMAANTFTDAEVAAFFNENFINLKMDMEKGEGPTLARKYKVRAYPTLYFFNADGTVAKQALGAKRPDGLLELGKSVASSDL